jgi:hypothetical protein
MQRSEISWTRRQWKSNNNNVHQVPNSTEPGALWRWCVPCSSVRSLEMLVRPASGGGEWQTNRDRHRAGPDPANHPGGLQDPIAAVGYSASSSPVPCAAGDPPASCAALEYAPWKSSCPVIGTSRPLPPGSSSAPVKCVDRRKILRMVALCSGSFQSA